MFSVYLLALVNDLSSVERGVGVPVTDRALALDSYLSVSTETDKACLSCYVAVGASYGDGMPFHHSPRFPATCQPSDERYPEEIDSEHHETCNHLGLLLAKIVLA